MSFPRKRESAGVTPDGGVVIPRPPCSLPHGPGEAVGLPARLDTAGHFQGLQIHDDPVRQGYFLKEAFNCPNSRE